MTIEVIWIGMYNTASMTLLVSVLVCGFYFCGGALFKLLRFQHPESSSVTIATGLSVTLFFAWYAYRIGIPLGILMVALFLITIAFTICKLAGRMRLNRGGNIIYPNGIYNSLYIFPFLAVAFSIQSFFAFESSNHIVGTIGNKDIYDWSMLAQYLLGAPGYDNVITTLGLSAQQHRIDSFGTFFALAAISKFSGKLPLEATPAFTILLMSLIGLSIFDLVKKLYGFKDCIAFCISLLVSAGAFFFYLTYNNFYAQLLSTFLYISMIAAILHIAFKEHQISFISRSLISGAPIAVILIVYPPGFLVFSFFSVTFCIIYGLSCSNRLSFLAALNSVKFLLYPLLFGILMGIVLLPELALYTFHRTIEVKDVVNGWPLPLIFPAHLLSLPVFTFGKLTGNLLYYFITFCVVSIVSIYAYLAAKRQSSAIAARQGAFMFFYAASIVVYLIVYLIKGEAYQVWKFGSFVVLPMSFVFLSASVYALVNANKKLGSISNILIVPILVIGCAFVLVINPSMAKVYSNSNQIEQFEAARIGLLNSGIENVILDSMDFGEVMIAFNMLSRDFMLYPLIRSYVAPVDLPVIKQLDPARTRVLVNAKCYPEDDGTTQSGYKTVHTDKLFIAGFKHFFNPEGAGCNISHGVYLKEGFSGNEPWGTWTDGEKARIRISIPPALVGKKLNVAYAVHPYGEEQSVSVSINGVSRGTSIIRHATNLNFEIPEKIAEHGELEFVFLIGNPLRPMDIDPVSLDNRLLGVGFISLSISLMDP